MMVKVGRIALAVALLGGLASAQRYWKFEAPAHGLTMKLPRWLEPVPTKPGDEQTIGQFKGKWKASDRTWGREPELTLLVVKIVRTEGPTTGGKEEEEVPEDPRSLTEMRVERLNAARSLAEYCEHRGYARGLLPENDLLKKPVEDENDVEYQLLKYPSPRGAKYGALLYAFADESTNESFGVIAIGPGCNAHFREVARAVSTIERTAVTADATDGADDPYAESELRDLERRRRVRSELVPGWSAHDSENYILVTNVKSNRMIEDMLTALEVMRAAYLERFPPAEGADMSAVSTVRLCDGYEDYLRYAGQRMDGTGGYWMFTEEELVLFNPERKVPRSRPWLAKVEAHRVMYHEAMHQYFHYSNRALAPASWFNEGYGEYFGGAEIDLRRQRLKEIDPNDFRLDLIRLANKQDRDPPNLKRMLEMTQAEFYGMSAMANYAYSWAFCHFLEEQRALSTRNRQRVEAWCELPDRYLAELRKATAEKRDEMPPGAPEDWIAGFQNEIQKIAIEKALEGIDMDALSEAFRDYCSKM